MDDSALALAILKKLLACESAWMVLYDDELAIDVPNIELTADEVGLVMRLKPDIG